MVAEIETGAVLAPATGGDQDWQPVPVPTGIRAGIIKVAVQLPAAPGGAEGPARGRRRPRRRPEHRSPSTWGGTRTRPGRSLDVLAGAGADLSRLSLDHLELRVQRFETLLELAETGCMLELDMFGHESSYYPLTETTCRAMLSAST